MLNKLSFFRLLACLFMLLGSANAQPYGVKLLTMPTKDSILIRWAPVDYDSWKFANEYGYVLNRYTIVKNKKFPKDIEKVVLSSIPLKPAPLEKWEPYADDKYVAITAECIFGSMYKDVPVNGNPFIAYKKYQERIHRYSFALFAVDQSITASKLAGLYYADKTAKDDEKYLYEVYINAPDTIAVDTAVSFTGLSEFIPLTPPLDLKADWNDKSVLLSWDFISLKHVYNSYFIEKSDDGGETFNRTSESGIVQIADSGITVRTMYYTDSLINNVDEFHYRIRGITAFGEISPPSDTVSGHGVLPIKNTPIIYSKNVIDNKYVELKWDYPEEMNQYITGFKIYRSSKPKGKKEIVYYGKSPDVRTFIDSTSKYNNYYLISVYNGKEEKLSHLKNYVSRIDSIPPLPPVELSAVIDSTGKVTLSWAASTEDDAKGYRVYSANNPKFEFRLITNSEIKDTFFIETINLNTLTKEIYYKIRATDQRGNHSSLSEIVKVVRPDIIPPVSPRIKEINNKDNTPEITWLNSSSSDVVMHVLYRKYESDTIYVKHKEIKYTGDNKTTYRDKEVEPGNTYHYYVSAFDDSGLESPPSNYGYFKIKSDKEDKIKLKKREFSDNVKLLWNIKTEKNVDKVLVYRSVDDSPLRVYANTREDNFTDKELSLDREYKYAIKLVYTDGTKSALSNYLKVRM